MHVLQKVYNFNNGDNSTKTIYKATIDQNNKNIYIYIADNNKPDKLKDKS